MEFELTNLEGFTTLGVLEEIQKMMTDSVNLSSSKVGSSSCQCTTTKYGENEETQKRYCEFCYSCELCSQILAGMLVIFWDLDQRRRGTELALINQTEIGTELLKE